MEDVTIAVQPFEAAKPALVERRRPGRLSRISPALLPLLRTAHEPNLDVLEAQFDNPDQLRPARGLGFALFVSALMWGSLIGVLWFAFSIFHSV